MRQYTVRDYVDLFNRYGAKDEHAKGAASAVQGWVGVDEEGDLVWSADRHIRWAGGLTCPVLAWRELAPYMSRGFDFVVAVFEGR
jgi:hypothetical protein